MAASSGQLAESKEQRAKRKAQSAESNRQQAQPKADPPLAEAGRKHEAAGHGLQGH